MRKPKRKVPAAKPDPLFDRIVTILEQARGNVVRAVNTNMVLAYWLIGREIVEELQGGEDRAEYGKKVIEDLSTRLTERYGKGFSEQGLQNFRRFYLAYSERVIIPSPTGRESSIESIPHTAGGESCHSTISSPAGRELTPVEKSHSAGDELPHGFCPQMSWSHYRALMRGDDPTARDFYEREAAECGWSKSQLERQIHTAYYQRIVANRGTKGLVAAHRFKVPGDNPTIGLILCTDKSEAVAKYSVLSEGRRIFASKYLQLLPSEQELGREIAKERRLIESAMRERRDLPEGSAS